MIQESHFENQPTKVQLRKYFVMIQTDAILENYKMIELKQYLWPHYEYISHRGIFPLVKYKL